MMIHRTLLILSVLILTGCGKPADDKPTARQTPQPAIQETTQQTPLAIPQPTVQNVPQQTPPPAVRQTRTETVYVTKTGTKYHRADCQYLHKSKIPMPLREAKAQGYEACKVCKP